MTDELSYIGRSLNARTYEAAEGVKRALETAMRKNSAAGMLRSGNTFIAFEAIMLEAYEKALNEAAKFVFNFTESNGPDVAEHLSFFAGRLRDITLDYLKNVGMRTGEKEHVVAEQLFKYQQSLDARKTRLMDDFNHGMMGSERLKKDPVVSVVQNHSPGAIQQVGLGQVSQSAIIDNRQALVQAIDQALASNEFAALTPQQKEGFIDLADTLKDEAKKSPPDVGKLRRWGNRLLEFSKEVGIKVATGTIAQVLTKMLGG